MNKFLQGLAVLGFSLAAFVFQMFVLIKLWSYIAVPMGATAIDLNKAVGISIIAGLLLPMVGEHKEDGVELAVKRIIHSFIQSLVSLGLGYFLFG